MVQLGLCGFRHAQIKDAHNALLDIQLGLSEIGTIDTLVVGMTVCMEFENAVFLHFEAHFKFFFLKINRIYVLICILEYIV